MWNHSSLPPLLLLITIQAARGAPTLGDDIIVNFKANMAAVHGNIMAAITNMLKPLLDLFDKVPNVIFGQGRQMAGLEPQRNVMSNIILGGAGALNSGIKLVSTLISAPFKLAGDAIIALENIVLGSEEDLLNETRKKKRDIRQMTIDQVIDKGLRALKQALDENTKLNTLSSRNGKRQVKPKFLEGLTQTLDKFNEFIAQKANDNGDFLLFLGQFFSRG